LASAAGEPGAGGLRTTELVRADSASFGAIGPVAMARKPCEATSLMK
jgi:hypothetical protein